MLQTIRDKAQGWIAWAIIIAIALTFVLMGSGSVLTKSADSQAVAKVNGQKISYQQLELAYQRYMNQVGPEAMNQLDTKMVKQDILQSLIHQTILLQAQEKMGMDIADHRLESILLSFPYFQANGQFSPERYSQFLAASGFTDGQFRQELREGMIKQQFEYGVMRTAFTLPMDLTEATKYLLQTRDFKTVLVPHKEFMAQVTIEEEALKAYYDKHAADFISPEQVSIEYISVHLPDIVRATPYTDADIKSFYQENLDLFSAPEKVRVAHIQVSDQDKLEQVRQALKGGTPFAELAKTYSEDKATSEKGGELSWLEASDMATEFDKAAFALSQPGQMGEVQTQQGWHLIKLLEKVEKKTPPFDEIKNKIIAQYQQQVGQDRFITLLDEMSVLAYDVPDTLKPIEDKFDLKIKTAGPFSEQSGPSVPRLQHPQVIQAAFSASVKEDKNNSELIQLDNDNYVVLRVTALERAKQKPFEVVKAEIKHRLVLEQSIALATDKAQSLIAALKSNNKDATREEDWQSYQGIKRDNKSLAADLIETVFTMNKPDGKPLYTTSVLPSGDVVVIQLNDVQDGQVSELAEQEVKSYLHSIANHYGELEYALYANALIESADVVKYLDRI